MAKDIWAQLEALNKMNAENAAKEAEAEKPSIVKKKRKKKGGLLGIARSKMRSRDDYINRAIRRATGK